MCKTHQERIANMARLDAEIRSRGTDGTVARPGAAGSASTTLLPSQLIEELRAFTSKFSPALFQAGFNAIRIAEVPMGWTQMVFMVVLDRLATASSNSRPWSRFRIDKALGVPVIALPALLGTENAQYLTDQKLAQEKRHNEDGHLGTITVVLSSRYSGVDPPLIVHNITCIAFGTHSRAKLEIGANWLETLNGTVDRLSGRISSAASSAR